MVRLPQGVVHNEEQERGASLALNAFDDPSRHGYLIADQMGSGKTIQALLFLSLLYQRGFSDRVVIVATASLIHMWAGEFAKWFPDRKFVLWDGSSQAKGAIGEASVLIVAYSMCWRKSCVKYVGPWLKGHKRVLVFDECQKAAGRPPKKSHVSRSLWERGGYAWPTNTEMGFVLCLSGTPMPNGRHGEMWRFLRHALQDSMSWSPEWNNWMTYARRFCGWRPVRIPGRVQRFAFKETDNTGKKVFGNLMRLVAVRRKKSVFANLPAKNLRLVKFPMKSMLEAVKRACEASNDVYEMPQVDVRKLFLMNSMGALSTALRMIGMGKSKACADWIGDLLDEAPEDPVVAFTKHKDVRREIVQRLLEKGFRVVGFDGDDPPEIRNKAVEDFQAGEADVFVSTLATASEGITLTRSHRAVMCELDWVPGIMAQAEDRIHRIGQEEKVLIDYLVVKDSLDETLFKVVKGKGAEMTDAISAAQGGDVQGTLIKSKPTTVKKAKPKKDLAVQISEAMSAPAGTKVSDSLKEYIEGEL